MRKTSGPNSGAPFPLCVPLALLITCLVAFGLFIPWLGFYQDDWHFIYYADQGLDKLWELSAYDNRPFASWPYIAGFAVLGFRPLAWQIAGVLLRWLTTVAFWLLFRLLWPRHANLAVIPALLFAVYPLYTLQPMAVTYITHWVCYLLYALSLWLMVLAVQEPGRRWPLLILSVILDGVQLFTIEYFNGIELIRPAVLWVALSGGQKLPRSRFKSVSLNWLPYLLLLLGFVYWRSFVFDSPIQDTNAPTVLRDLLGAPLPTFIYLVTAMLKDSLLILVGTWSGTVSPALVDLSPAGLAILAVSVLSFFGFLIYLRQLPSKAEEGPPIRQLLLLGALGLVLGPIPAWVTRQPLYDTNPIWNSRLGMASMFGAALIITALAEWMIRTRNQRILVYSLLLALSIGHLLRSGNSYRHAWETQVRFLNQLAWRAPGIAAGTPVISDGELLPLMGDYPTAFAMNMLYGRPAVENLARVWFFPGYPLEAGQVGGDGELRETKFSTQFEGMAGQSLVIWFDSSLSACLHVLTPWDSGSSLYSDFLQEAAAHSHIERISIQPELNTQFIRQALDTPRDWCSFYETAELAAQFDRWAEVLQIWNAARERGLETSHGAEYLPFIRAFLRLGDYPLAKSLTETAINTANLPGLRPTLCRAWQESSGMDPDTRSQVYRLLACAP